MLSTRWDYIQCLISNKICVRNCANVLDGVNRVVMRYYAFPCNAVRAPEHLTVNQGVTGSSPVGGAKACIRLNVGFFRPLIGVCPLYAQEKSCRINIAGIPSGALYIAFGGVFCHNSELSSITLTERRSFSSIAPKTSVHIWRLCALQSVEKCYILRNKGKYNLMVKFETG